MMSTMAGDHVAGDRVEATYREVHGRLWRALVSFTGDPEVASDAEAEAFAQALQRGDGIVDVAAWVWRSAFRIAAGMLAARSRRREVLDFDRVAGASASLVEFVSLLGGLSDQQRACVVLRHVGGFTSTEIAELLDTSPTTVRVQLHRAHGSLRRSLMESQHG
jgi:RNA polymerase sigma-70 factor (ECF subfamily)